MDIEIREKPKEVIEVIECFYYLANEEAINSSRAETLDKYNLTNNTTLKKMHGEIEKYLKAFKKKCTIDASELDLFFKDIYGNYDSKHIAGLLINTEADEDLLVYKESIINKSEEEVKSEVFKNIVNVLEDAEYDNLEDLPLKVDKAIEYFSNKNISSEAKWKLIVILNDAKRYIIRLIDTILLNIQAYKVSVKNVLTLSDKVVLELKDRIKQDDKYICNLISINMDGLKKIIVYPAIANQYSVTAKFHEDGLFIYFGVMFEYMVSLTSKSKDSKNKVQNILRILSDKSKLEILQLLKQKEHYGIEIAEKLNLTTATVSYHMNNLLLYGFICVEKVENRVYYRLNKDNISEFLKDLEEILLK
ncbi:winged helix-turn-helix domain-containing protein [Clostridium sp. C8-1-8]|uniref:ArsR/SmtB family transcription factor n=1 Tax=Clostridium sp. C8-1-8 TaxID=2698831 RepID=UPI001368C9BA|nr:winged helix-turn-helix domain-containing protein [Clostridium sp. C8-1-8]